MTSELAQLIEQLIVEVRALRQSMEKQEQARRRREGEIE